MINQPFAPSTVWFLFATPYKYEDLEATSVVQFDETPKGVFASKQEIFKNIDMLHEELRKSVAGSKGSAQEWALKIIDGERQWRSLVDFGNQIEIQFARFDDGRVLDKQPVGKPPLWLEDKKVTMEIWEDQSYYKNIYDGSDVYCFVEVIL